MDRKTRCLSFLVICLLVLVVGVAQAAPSDIKDVPVTHWAYDAVRTLVGRGYLSVGQDGAFRGNDPVDRYTLASVLAQILAEVESGRASASADDLQLMRKLTDEYRAELVQYYAEQEKMAKGLEASNRRFGSLDEKMNEALVSLVVLSDRTDALRKEIDAHGVRNAAVDQQANETRRELDRISSSLTSMSNDLSARVQQLQADTAVLQQMLNQQAARNRTDVDDLNRLIVTGDNAVRTSVDASIARLEQDQAQKNSVTDESIRQLNSRIDSMQSALATDSKRAADSLALSVSALSQELKGIESRINASLGAETTARTAQDRALEASINQKYAEMQVNMGNLLRDVQEQLAKLNELDSRLVAFENSHQQLVARQQADQKQNELRLGSLESNQAELRAVVDIHAQQIDSLKNESALQAEQLRLAVADVQTKSGQTSQSQALQSGRIDLVEKGLANQQAATDQRFVTVEADVTTLRQSLATDVNALKQRLDSLDSSLRSEMVAKDEVLGTELRNEMAASEERLRSELSQLTSATDTQGAELQGAVAVLEQRLQAKIESTESNMNAKFAGDLAQQDLSLRQDIKSTSDALADELAQNKAATDQRVLAVQSDVTALKQSLDNIDRSLRSEMVAKDEVLGTELRNEMTASEERLRSELSQLASATNTQGAELQGAVAVLEQGLKAQMASTESRIADSLAQQDVSLRQEIKAVNDALASELVQNKAATDQRLLAAEADVTTLQQSLEAMGRSLHTEIASAQADSSAKIASDMTALKDSLLDEMVTRDRTLGDELRDEIRAVEGKLGSKIDSNQLDMESRLASLGNDVIDLRSELRTSIGELAEQGDARDEELKATVSRLQDQDATLGERIDAIQSTINGMARTQERYAESLAAQQQALEKLESDLNAKHDADIASLRSELASEIEQLNRGLQLARQELSQVQAKLLMYESQLGLSDEQLAQLDQRIVEHLNMALARERSLSQDIADMTQRYEADQAKAQREIKSARTTAWVTAAVAALLGIFVSAP